MSDGGFGLGLSLSKIEGYPPHVGAIVQQQRLSAPLMRSCLHII